MTLPNSGPVSIGDVIAETAHCKGSLSKQGVFVSSEKRSLKEIIAPNFQEVFDQFGNVTPWKNVGIKEFHNLNGYKDNNYLISDGVDGKLAHSARATDTEAKVITTENGFILRTNEKDGEETVIKHENANVLNVDDIFLFAEFCREFGTPDSAVYFLFTNVGTIQNLHKEQHLWPENSKVFILNSNNGSCINPNLGQGLHELI
ncbi:MAG: hypothetical protein CMM25_08460 [Rhodospirillaceae bacterium]|nr:hypothetical protein [Rhodospirillaceae bacterium]